MKYSRQYGDNYTRRTIESSPTMGGWIVRITDNASGYYRQFTGIKSVNRSGAEAKALEKISIEGFA